MAAADGERPIIIKKVKKGVHAAHGGAWKVAYADFVTAMMAFFLLLWLLNVTTDEQKKGVADYFSPASVRRIRLQPVTNAICWTVEPAAACAVYCFLRWMLMLLTNAWSAGVPAPTTPR